MSVIKRDGRTEVISFDKIFTRINAQSIYVEDQYKLSNSVNIFLVCKKTIELMNDNMTTESLDKLSASICADLITSHSDYSFLGSRILISNLKKNLMVRHGVITFSEITGLICKFLPNYLNDEYLDFVEDNSEFLDQIIDENNDYNLDYFGFKTLEKSYLIKNLSTEETLETPQALWLRVSIAIHCSGNEPVEEKLKQIKKNYNLIAQGKFIHATPTLFNAGSKFQQLSSCYLLGIDDSLEGIFKNMTDCARISKWAGGIGLHISNIRGKGQIIKKTNGESAGVIPMLQVLNNIGRYISQGGKRRGSIACYIEPWHIDIIDFLELRKNGGNESEKCRDLFLALWVPDLFMQAVEQNKKWYLMSEDTCPGLSDSYGNEFETLYNSYVKQKKYIKEVDANMIWQKIISSQIETGTPYICFKDSINKKSNQQNIGVIKSSNLCAEIVQYSSDTEYAVCNLASIAVNKFYNEETKEYDFDELHMVAKQATLNLNKIIDINYYPTPETEFSNLKNRPIGVGVQGFADLLAIMKLPYDSSEAIKLSADLQETIYHGCLEQSNELAIIHGHYDSFANSPLSNGKFQFNLWNLDESKLSGRWDWETLRIAIITHGTRNSLTTALMPTASTSQILGNNECFEPVTSNLYTRRTLAGNFIVFNKHLQKDLEQLGLWNDQMKINLMAGRGSIQNIASIPQNIKDIYKTVWEIKQKVILDHAISRGPFVDQSQSMNIFFAKPDKLRLATALFYGWRNGLKTGIYYLRSQASAEAQQFTIEPTNQTKTQANTNTNDNANTNECTMCSS